MKITRRQEIWIEEFIKDVGGGEVRGRNRAERLGRPEIRSKKHNILAIKWDELGNGFACATMEYADYFMQTKFLAANAFTKGRS